MATTYTPNESTSTEEITLPEPGDPGNAESVNLPLRRIADRVKAIASTVTASPGSAGVIQSINSWGIADTKGSGVGLSATSTTLPTSKGLVGTGPFGVVGYCTGNTFINKAVSGIATLGQAVGVYGESATGAAGEFDGKGTQYAMLLRGFLHWALSSGVGDHLLNPTASTGLSNTVVPKNVCKSWGHVVDGQLIDGFNIGQMTVVGTGKMRVTMAAPMSNNLYAVSVSVGTGYPSDFDKVIRPSNMQANAPFERTEWDFYIEASRLQLDIGGLYTHVPVDFDSSSFTFHVYGAQPLGAV